MDGVCLHPYREPVASVFRRKARTLTEILEERARRVPPAYVVVTGRRVTVAPCVHFDAQPPQSSPVNGGPSAVRIENTRDPESSAGTNAAPHTPQGCSRWEGWCFTDIVTLAIRLS